MNTAEIKYQIISSITEIEDESILDKVTKYLAAIKKKRSTVGYDNYNQPITSDDLAQQHLTALTRINNGHFSSLNDVLNEAENW